MGPNKNLALALVKLSFIVLEVRLENEIQIPVKSHNYAADPIEENIQQQYDNPSEVTLNTVTDGVLAFGLDDKFKHTVQNPPNGHQRILSAKDRNSISPLSGDVISGESSVDVANTGSELKDSPIVSFETKSRIKGIENYNSSKSFDSKVTRYVQSYINQSQISSHDSGFVAIEKLPFKDLYLMKRFTNSTELLTPETDGHEITEHNSYDLSKHGAESMVDKKTSLTGFGNFGTLLWNDPILFSNRLKRNSLINSNTGHNFSFELKQVVLFDQEIAKAESGLRNLTNQTQIQNLNLTPFSSNTSSDESTGITNNESSILSFVTNNDLLTDYTTESPSWGQNISTSDKPHKTSGAKSYPSLLNPAQSSSSSSAKPLTGLQPPTASSPPPSTSRHSLATSSIPKPSPTLDPWPVKLAAETHGDLILGGLMMVHEREDSVTCGPIMPQGGIQALETMLYTLDVINSMPDAPFTLGAHILDDCDKDTYGLEMAVDFIKGEQSFFFFFRN